MIKTISTKIDVSESLKAAMGIVTYLKPKKRLTLTPMIAIQTHEKAAMTEGGFCLEKQGSNEGDPTVGVSGDREGITVYYGQRGDFIGPYKQPDGARRERYTNFTQALKEIEEWLK